MSRPKKNLYLISMGDDLELPVFAGNCAECAAFMGISERAFYDIASRQKRIGGYTESGFEIHKIEEEPWELTMCDMMCPGGEEE